MWLVEVLCRLQNSTNVDTWEKGKGRGGTAYTDILVLLSNDTQLNPGPRFDRTFQYIRRFLDDETLARNILIDHVDKVFQFQQRGNLIPKEFLTDDNILMWADLESKAEQSSHFDVNFCSQVHSIWSFWEDEADKLEEAGIPIENDERPSKRQKMTHSSIEDKTESSAVPIIASASKMSDVLETELMKPHRPGNIELSVWSTKFTFSYQDWTLTWPTSLESASCTRHSWRQTRPNPRLLRWVELSICQFFRCASISSSHHVRCRSVGEHLRFSDF
jgi:hypothetical protein